MSPYWIFLSLFFVGLGITTALKGKYVLAALGIIVPFWLWPLGAVRLAKPRSVWARCFYDDVKLQRAAVRYGQEQVAEPDPRLRGLAAEIAESAPD